MVFCAIVASVVKAPGKIIEFRSYEGYQKGKFIQDLRNVNWSVINNETTVDSAVLAWNDPFLSVVN